MQRHGMPPRRLAGSVRHRRARREGAPPRRPPQLPRAPAAAGGRCTYESRVERDAMMAPAMRADDRGAPSRSGRPNGPQGTLDGLEPLGSGPRITPVEPATGLDPKGGDGEVSWHGRPCDVDRVVSARWDGGGGRAGARGHDDGGAGGVVAGAGGRGRPGGGARVGPHGLLPPRHLYRGGGGRAW